MVSYRCDSSIKFTVTRSTIADADWMAFAPGPLQLASGTVGPAVRAANRFQYRRWCCRGRCSRCRTSASSATAPSEEAQLFAALLCQRLAFGRNHGRWLLKKRKKTMRYNGLWFEINDPLFISLLDVLQLSLSNTSDFRPVLDYLHTSSWIASDVCNICDRFGEILRRDWISPFRSHPSWFPGRKSPVIWRRLLASPIRLLSLTYSR